MDQSSRKPPCLSKFYHDLVDGTPGVEDETRLIEIFPLSVSVERNHEDHVGVGNVAVDTRDFVVGVSLLKDVGSVYVSTAPCSAHRE